MVRGFFTTGLPIDLDRARVHALCFDVNGTIAGTDHHLVTQIAAMFDAVTLVGAQTTRRMKPHPEPLLHTAEAIRHRGRTARSRCRAHAAHHV